MPSLCDVSFLLPLCHGQHEHHAAAKEHLDGVAASGELVVCRLSQLGLLRLLSNPSVMGSGACTADPGSARNSRGTLPSALLGTSAAGQPLGAEAGQLGAAGTRLFASVTRARPGASRPPSGCGLNGSRCVCAFADGLALAGFFAGRRSTGQLAPHPELGGGHGACERQQEEDRPGQAASQGQQWIHGGDSTRGWRDSPAGGHVTPPSR